MEEKVELNKKNKYVGVDIARITAAIFVFLIHFSLNIQQWTTYEELTNVHSSYIIQCLIFAFKVIIRSAVPIFLIISGFCNYKHEDISLKGYVTKITKNYIPYIVACVFYLITYISIKEINDLQGVLHWGRQVINFSLSYMWYMGSYLILLLLMPYINRGIKQLSNKEHLLLIGILTIAVSLPLTINSYGTQVLNEYYIKGFNIILYYIVGTFLRRNINLINKKNVIKMIIILILMSAVSFLLLPISGMNVIDKDGMLCLISSITVFMTIFYFGNKLKENKIISKISSVTLLMYMLGWSYERLVYHFLGTKIFANNMLYCIIFIVCEIFITIIISIVLQKILNKVNKKLLQLLKIEKKDEE